MEIWIARDKDGKLVMYEKEPLKDKLAGQWTLGGWFEFLPKNWFPEVHWSDKKPLKIFLVTEDNYKLLQKEKEIKVNT